MYEKKQRNDEEMPQSAAIQEKLRRFEPINTTPDSAKPFGSKSNEQFIVHPSESNEKKRKDLSLGRSLIDENRVNMHFVLYSNLTFYDLKFAF